MNQEIRPDSSGDLRHSRGRNKNSFVGHRPTQAPGEQPKRPFSLIIFLPLAFFSLSFFGSYLEARYWDHRFELGPVVQTAATITKVWPDKDGDTVGYRLDIFGTTSDQRQAGVSRLVFQELQVGERVRAEFLANNPDHSRLPFQNVSGQEKEMLIFGAVALVLSVILALGSRPQRGRWVKHIPVVWHESASVVHVEQQTFYAPFKEHRIFSSMIFLIGAGLAWTILSSLRSQAEQESLVGSITMLIASFGLMSLPFIIAYLFYVRVDDDGIEARGFGNPKRIAWRDMQGIWKAWTPQVEFEGTDCFLRVNFKFFSIECYQAVSKQVHDLFGKSI